MVFEKTMTKVPRVCGGGGTEDREEKWAAKQTEKVPVTSSHLHYSTCGANTDKQSFAVLCYHSRFNRLKAELCLKDNMQGKVKCH